VLIFGQTSVATERLHLPHPRIAERDFVLQPLADIAPDLKLFGESVQVLLEKLPLVELQLVSEVLC